MPNRTDDILSLTQNSNPKAQPKSAVADKTAKGGETTRGARGGRGGRGARGARRGRNAGRSKPKTAEELDAEMTDYFVANGNEAAATSNGAAPAANGGDDQGMDEVLVSNFNAA
jgi:THO complex subunit 4